MEKVVASRLPPHDMNRFPELRDLSEDHHHGLVLARLARRAASGEADLSVEGTWAEAERRMGLELDPHFKIEETLIVPALECRGEVVLTEKLRADHADLRACFAPGASRTADALRRFGDLLESHIRFEEREFFEAAQRALTSDELLAVEKACRARRPPDGGAPEK